MSAGTLTLINNSATISGVGTSFNTELAPGDFVVVIAGGVTYTLPVKSVDSPTQITIIKAYDGPSQNNAAWYAVPRNTLNAITAQLAAETAKAMRGLNFDKDNWQQVFSGSGSIVIKLPDGSAFTGPSWNAIAKNVESKADKKELDNYTKNIQLTDGSGGHWYAAFNSRIDFAMFSWGDTPLIGQWDAPAKYSTVNYFPSTSANIGTAISSSWGSDHEYYLNSKNAAYKDYQAWKGWSKLWHSRNTTVDSNGFIKKASPIARLSAEPEKMPDDYLNGFTLHGYVAVNSEAEGVTAERVSIGVYKVSGALGFAKEGWNIEVPQDVNGNRLCFVETSACKDGTIYVKVSKRRFDVDTGAFEAGVLMDIPSGRWIDLRLEMPADKTKGLVTSDNEIATK